MIGQKSYCHVILGSLVSRIRLIDHDKEAK